jgi:hypothetical protein
MFDTKKYDFSLESELKYKLLERLKSEHKKARGQAIPLADDDLDMVAAAGDDSNGEKCPTPDKSCELCNEYTFGRCTAGYIKDQK